MNWDVLTLGERIVMIARIAAAEHIRLAAKDSGVEIDRLGRLICDAKVPSSPFSQTKVAPMHDPGEAA